MIKTEEEYIPTVGDLTESVKDLSYYDDQLKEADREINRLSKQLKEAENNREKAYKVYKEKEDKVFAIVAKITR